MYKTDLRFYEFIWLYYYRSMPPDMIASMWYDKYLSLNRDKLIVFTNYIYNQLSCYEGIKNISCFIYNQFKLHIPLIFKDFSFYFKEYFYTIPIDIKEILSDINEVFLNYYSNDIYMYKEREKLVFPFKNLDGSINDNFFFVNADILFRKREKVISFLKIKYGNYIYIPYNYPFFFKNRILFIDPKLVTKNIKSILNTDMFVVIPDYFNNILLDGIQFNNLNYLNTVLYKSINKEILKKFLEKNMYVIGYEFITLENINVYLNILKEEFSIKSMDFFLDIFLQRYCFEMDILLEYYSEQFNMFSELFIYNKLYINSIIYNILNRFHIGLMNNGFKKFGYDDIKIYLCKVFLPVNKYILKLSKYGDVLKSELAYDKVNFNLQFMAWKIIHSIQYNEHGCNFIFYSHLFNGTNDIFNKTLFYKTNLILPKLNYFESIYNFKAKNLFKSASKSVINKYGFVMRILVPKNLLYFNRHLNNFFGNSIYNDNTFTRFESFYKSVYRNIFFQFFMLNFENKEYTFFNKNIFFEQANFIFKTFFERNNIWLRRLIFEIENWKELNRHVNFLDCYKNYSQFIKLYVCVYTTIKNEFKDLGELGSDKIFLKNLKSLGKKFLHQRGSDWLQFEYLMKNIDELLQIKIVEAVELNKLNVNTNNILIHDNVLNGDSVIIDDDSNNNIEVDFFENVSSNLSNYLLFLLKSINYNYTISYIDFNVPYNIIEVKFFEKEFYNNILYNNIYINNKFYFYEEINKLYIYLNKYIINNSEIISVIFNNLYILNEYKELYNLDYLLFSYIDKNVYNKLYSFILLNYTYINNCKGKTNFVYKILYDEKNNKLNFLLYLYLFNEKWNFISLIDNKNIDKYLRYSFLKKDFILNELNYNIDYYFNTNEIYNNEEFSNIYYKINLNFKKNYLNKIFKLINYDLINLLNCDSNSNLFKLLLISYNKENDNFISESSIKDKFDEELIIDYNNSFNFVNIKDELIRENFYLNLSLPSFFNENDFLNLKTGVNFPSIIAWYCNDINNDKYLYEYGEYVFDNVPLNCLYNYDSIVSIYNEYVYNNYSSKLYFLINSIEKSVNSNNSIFLYRSISIDDLFKLININIINKKVCFFTLDNFNFFTFIIMDFFMNSKLVNLFYKRLLYEVMHEVYYNIFGHVVEINSIFRMYSQYFNIGNEINVTLYNKLCFSKSNDLSESSSLSNAKLSDQLYLNFLKENWSDDVFYEFKSNLVRLNNILVLYYSRFNLNLKNDNIFNWTLNSKFNYRKLYSDIHFIRYKTLKLNPLIPKSELNDTIEGIFIHTILPTINFKIESLMSSINFFEKKLNFKKLFFTEKDKDGSLFYLVIGKYWKKDRKVCIEIEYSELFNLIIYLYKCPSSISIRYFANGNIWYWPDFLKYSFNVIEEFERYFKTLVYSYKLGFKKISDTRLDESNLVLRSIRFFFSQFCKELRYFSFNKDKEDFLFEIHNYANNKELIDDFFYYYVKWYIRINNFLTNYMLFSEIESGLMIYDKNKSLYDDYTKVSRICDRHELIWSLMEFKLIMMKEFISMRYSLSSLLIYYPRFYFFFDIKESEFLKDVKFEGENLIRLGFFKKDNIDKFNYKDNLTKVIKLIEFYSGKLSFRFIKDEFLSILDPLLDGGEKYENFFFKCSRNLDWNDRKEFLYFYTKYKNEEYISFSTNFMINMNINFINYFKSCLMKDFIATVRVSGYTGIDINPFIINKLYKGFKKFYFYKYVSDQSISIYNRVFFNYLPITNWDLHKFIMCDENCNLLQFLMIKEFTTMFLHHLNNFEAVSCRLPVYLNKFLQNIELYRISLLKEPETLALYFNKNYKCIKSEEEKKFFDSFDRNISFIDSLKSFLEKLTLTVNKKYFESDKSFNMDYDQFNFSILSLEKFYIKIMAEEGRANYISFLEAVSSLSNFEQRFKLLKQLLLQIKISSGLFDKDEYCVKFFSYLWYNYANFVEHKFDVKWINVQRNKNIPCMFITAGPNIRENDMFFFSKYNSKKEGELIRKLMSETQCYIDYRMLVHKTLDNEVTFFIKLFNKYIANANKKISTFLLPVYGFRFFENYVGKPELKLLNVYTKFYSSWTLENYEHFFISRTNISVNNSLSYMFSQMNEGKGMDYFIPTIRNVIGFIIKLLEIQHKVLRGIMLDDLDLNVNDVNNWCNTNFNRVKLINLVSLNNYFHRDFFKVVKTGLDVIESKLWDNNVVMLVNDEVLCNLHVDLKKAKKLLLDSDEILAVLRGCIRFYCIKNRIPYDTLNVHIVEEDRVVRINSIKNYATEVEKMKGCISKTISEVTLNVDYKNLYEEDMKMKGEIK